MSIRIGIYDFFAYTLPGVLYILIFTYGLTVFGFTQVDLSMLNNISLSSILVLIGAGYLVGLLIDPIALKWVTLFIGRNGLARRQAFDTFHKQHPWLELNFDVEDWSLLLFALKSKSTEGVMDLEMHNVASILLRNVSLGLVMISIIFILFFVLVTTNLWNLVLAVVALVLSGIAVDRCKLRRNWFYLGILEAFVAYYMFQAESIGDKRYIKINKPESQGPELNLTSSNSNPSESAADGDSKKLSPDPVKPKPDPG